MAKPSRQKGRDKGPREDGGGAPIEDAAGSPKLWGGRFNEAMAAVVEAYTSSALLDEPLVEYDILASIGHARMLGAQGIIPREDASRIERGLKEILEEWDRGEFQLRPELEDVHMNVETRLTAKIGAAAGRLHTARSRNDQIATDLRLYTSDAMDAAATLLLRLQETLVEVAETHLEVIMPGYTHLQRAQPVLFSHHLMAYVEMFERDFNRFDFARAMVDELPLGSGALAGVPYRIDREAVAGELEVDGISRNSMDAVSNRDFVADYVYAAALTMVHLSRLAEELVLWSSAEFAFVRLPDGFATGSSIMPQKKNADVAELARGRTGRAIGALVNILTVLKGLPLTYNRDLQEDKGALYDAQGVLEPTLVIMAELLPRLEVDVARMRAAAAANYSLATDLADYLVRKGLAFREAHEAVGKLVRKAESQGVELHDLPLEEYHRVSPLFAEDARAIDVASSVGSRDVPGGTAPARVKEEIAKAKMRIARTQAQYEDGDGDPGQAVN